MNGDERVLARENRLGGVGVGSFDAVGISSCSQPVPGLRMRHEAHEIYAAISPPKTVDQRGLKLARSLNQYNCREDRGRFDSAAVPYNKRTVDLDLSPLVAVCSC